MLARAGKDVVLLEKDTIGSGATHATTAFISFAVDTSLSDLSKMFGPDVARRVWESGIEALSTIARIIEQEHISCEFTYCPAYLYARTDRQFRRLMDEHAHAQVFGFQSTLIRRGELPFKNSGYLVLPEQAKFQPLLFLDAVADAAVKAGARIFEHSEVTSLSETGDVVVRTKSGVGVRADDAIVATYMPFNNPKATHFKKGMYRSYVLEVEVPRTSLHEGIYWDQANPYTYFRFDRHGDGGRIILGGADHRAEIPIPADPNFHVLEDRLEEVLGDLPYTITRKWHGPILEASDGLPLIGAYAPHRYVATAFSGNGMTYSVVAALILRDLLLGRPSVWGDIYDPTRALTAYRLYKKGIDYAARFLRGALNALHR
jgi:glycine/D-amino acid oxidase-like deaminating enzyme